jgi:protocatechuate 3,4-dioxygenase beta subunit
MRTTLAAALLLPFIALAQQPVSVDGLVINSATRQTMPGVHVRMEYLVRGSMRTLAYGATTDEHGRFAVAEIKPGTYYFQLTQPGFIHVRGQSPDALPTPAFTLKEGEHRGGLVLEMAPEAVVSGRVVDEFGDPIPGVWVHADLVGAKHLGSWMESNSDTSDDRGTYRIAIPPGKYLVNADPNQTSQDEPDEIRTDGSSESAYHAIYYLNTATKSAATAVDLRAGAERDGIDFRFTHANALSISGTVSGIPPGANVELKLATWGHEDFETEIEYEQTIKVDTKGSFSIPHLDPGKYRLYGGCVVGGTQLRTPMQEIELSTAPAAVNLLLGPGQEISGVLEMAPGAGPAAGRSVRVESTASTNGWGPSQNTPVAEDGTFRMTAIQPDRYRVMVLPKPPSQFVTVWVDNQPAAHEIIDLLSLASGSKLKIGVSNKGGQISGKVESGDTVVDHAFSMVFLMPEGDLSVEALQFQQTNKDGTFTFDGLRPGKYRLFAIDPMSDHNPSGRDWWKTVAPKADLIDVQEGEKLTRNARAIQ